MTTNKQELYRRFLPVLLRHVSFDGWSMRALRLVAKDLGEDFEVVSQVFPGGAMGMVNAFIKAVDEDMVQALANRDLRSLKVRERIALAVRLRLETITPHREAVRRGLDMSLDEASAFEATAFGLVNGTDDAREGTQAFVEKRKPRFAGR